jgi:hypothetical protein
MEELCPSQVVRAKDDGAGCALFEATVRTANLGGTWFDLVELFECEGTHWEGIYAEFVYPGRRIVCVARVG